jgi:hypothetical protein
MDNGPPLLTEVRHMIGLRRAHYIRAVCGAEVTRGRCTEVVERTTCPHCLALLPDEVSRRKSISDIDWAE